MNLGRRNVPAARETPKPSLSLPSRIMINKPSQPMALTLARVLGPASARLQRRRMTFSDKERRCLRACKLSSESIVSPERTDVMVAEICSACQPIDFEAEWRHCTCLADENAQMRHDTLIGHLSAKFPSAIDSQVPMTKYSSVNVSRS